MTDPKIITIQQASGVQAQGWQVGEITADGRASVDADGLILTGWLIPSVRNAPAPHPVSGNNREAREGNPPIVGGCGE